VDSESSTQVIAEDLAKESTLPNDREESSDEGEWSESPLTG
jgi:hypothetical protein